jgi:hypothetical protein
MLIVHYGQYVEQAGMFYFMGEIDFAIIGFSIARLKV